MLAEKRYEEILKIVDAQGSVAAMELTHLLGASEATIRRDISALAKMGKLNKVFGGATKMQQEFMSIENDMRTKLGMHTSQKEAVARYCASLVSDEDFVYIDAGSTTLMMIEFLRGCKATFVTTGLAQAKKLMQLGLRTYLVGGYLKKQTDAIIGCDAVNGLKKFNFTKAAAVSQSSEVFFLVDSSKFGKVCAYQIASLSKGKIITEELLDKSYEEYTVVKEVRI